MNTADYIKHEADEIASRTGRYIPPYRLANLMKTAQRITDQIVRSDVAMTYRWADHHVLLLRGVQP